MAQDLREVLEVPTVTGEPFAVVKVRGESLNSVSNLEKHRGAVLSDKLQSHFWAFFRDVTESKLNLKGRTVRVTITLDPPAKDGD